MEGEEFNIEEVHGFGLFHEGFAVCALACEYEVNIAAVDEHFGAVEYGGEALGQAVGADVHDDGLVTPAVLFSWGGAIAVAGGVEVFVDAIGDGVEFFDGDAAGCDFFGGGFGNGNDGFGFSVHEHFEPFEAGNDDGGAHDAEVDDLFGPEVAYFEYEGGAFEFGDEVSCKSAEHLGGSGDDDVCFACVKNGEEDGGEHEGEEADAAFEDAFVGGGK